MNMNKNQYQRVIKDLLLIHQYSVEVYQAKAKNTTWDLISKVSIFKISFNFYKMVSFQASPGNLQDFEDMFADSSTALENTAVVALKFISTGTGTVWHFFNLC